MIRTAATLKAAPREVIDLALEGHLVVRRKSGYEIGLLSGEERCMWIEVDGAPAGVLLWVPRDNGRIWWVDFTYVDPKHRATGAYFSMRGKLVELARAEGAKRIESHVGIGNKRMHDLMLRVGSRPVATQFYMEV